MVRRTKIVCTIGPRTSSREQLRRLIDAGMNVARVNLSHGTHDQHREVIRTLEELRAETGRHIGVLADLSGPKIRLGTIDDEPLNVVRGQEIRLTSERVVGTASRISVSYPHLSEDVSVGDPIMIADGTICARVAGIEGPDIVCRIEKGGRLSSHKGVNFPSTPLRVPSLTEKDHRDLEMALDEGVDFVALSFVRQANDMRQLRELVDQTGKSTRLIAKIEKQEALANFASILEASDGVMVARGDLGVETELAEMPLVQKRLIAEACEMARPVITATQMLESMVENPIPTRAEVTDVANAIIDGTDAVMLSEETAIGDYAIESVEIMARIAEMTEAGTDGGGGRRRSRDRREFTVTEAIGNGTALIASDLDVAAILVSTSTGATARSVSRFRPSASIIACTPDAAVARQLSLSWGVIPTLLPNVDSTDEMIDEATVAAKETGVVSAGDRVVITAGIPFGVVGGTNLLMVQTLA